MAEEIEPISADEARQRVEAAVAERLGENWRIEAQEWVLTHDTDFLIRLSRGSTNLDFQVDLLGEVSVTEREASLVQSSGRIIAWMLLGSSLFLAFVLAQLAGVFN